MDMNEIWTAIIQAAMIQAKNVTDDQAAITMKVLYKNWNSQIGKQLELGEYVQHNDKLYRVLQSHTAQANWEPGVGTESLFVVIDKEHAGTMDDPTPYEGNMELYNGKYYIQNEVVYLCIRDSGIALQHDLATLIDLYVVIAETETVATGTKDDPIVFNYGMVLSKGLYYTQHNVKYECLLNSAAPIYHDLKDLVGLYVIGVY